MFLGFAEFVLIGSVGRFGSRFGLGDGFLLFLVLLGLLSVVLGLTLRKLLALLGGFGVALGLFLVGLFLFLLLLLVSLALLFCGLGVRLRSGVEFFLLGLGERGLLLVRQRLRRRRRLGVGIL